MEVFILRRFFGSLRIAQGGSGGLCVATGPAYPSVSANGLQAIPHPHNRDALGHRPLQ